MRCANCGQDNPAEAKFCGRCATRLASAEPPFPPGPPRPPSNTGDVSQGLKTGIILGTLIMPLLGIIMGAIYMKESNPSRQAAGRIWLYVGIGVMAVYCVCTLASGVLNNLNQL